MRKATILTLAALAAIGATGDASAGVPYSGGTYVQDFDSPGGLPAAAPSGNTIPVNGSGHIQSPQNTSVAYSTSAPWSGGWRDNYVTDNTYMGIPNWYLYHDATLGIPGTDGVNSWYSTGGANGHAQFRYGQGGGGTGFFAFSSSPPGGTEKALGTISSTAFGARMYIGLQLINDTGKTLDSFTVTYDGEQWRKTTPNTPDGFDLQWSLATTAAGWQSSNILDPGGFYDGTSGVDYGGFANSFISPINDGAAGLLNGNLPANRSADITHTVTGINWAPGAELWIRWRDISNAAQDGIAIDNVRFSATGVPEPTSLALLAMGGLALAGRRRRA